MIQVILPAHLRVLAKVNRAVEVEIGDPPTITAVLDALEEQYPVLGGTLRDHVTKERRPFIRFFACGEDLTHNPADSPLPAEVVQGKEPLRIVGAIAGG